jgi:hypothetical protein
MIEGLVAHRLSRAHFVLWIDCHTVNLVYQKRSYAAYLVNCADILNGVPAGSSVTVYQPASP